MRLWVLIAIVVSTSLAVESSGALELKSTGVMVGGSWMNQTYKYTTDEFHNPADNGIPGFVAGVFSSVELGHQFAASLEAFYVRKGFEATFFATDQSDPLGERTETFAADYLSLPVAVRFGVDSHTLKPYCFAGLGAEIRLNSGDSELFHSFNSTTLSGHFGIGLEWRRFGLNVRYLRDLRNASDPNLLLKSVKNDGVVTLITFAIWQ